MPAKKIPAAASVAGPISSVRNRLDANNAGCELRIR